MSAGYFAIADSESVRAAQIHHGSRAAQARAERHAGLPSRTPRFTLDEVDQLDHS